MFNYVVGLELLFFLSMVTLENFLIGNFGLIDLRRVRRYSRVMLDELMNVGFGVIKWSF